MSIILATTEGAGGGMWINTIWIVAIIAVMYFVMIRPQNKQEKKRKEMISNVTVGDEVYTSGGIMGVITRVKEKTVWMRVAEKTEIEVLKEAISGVTKSTKKED